MEATLIHTTLLQRTSRGHDLEMPMTIPCFNSSQLGQEPQLFGDIGAFDPDSRRT